MVSDTLPVIAKPSRRKTLTDKRKGAGKGARARDGGLPRMAIRVGESQLRSWHREAASRGLSTAEWLRRAAEHYKGYTDEDE